MPSFSKNILAFDTALGGCSVGVRTISQKSATRQIETARDQARLLVPLIEEVLREVQLEYAELDLIVSTIGPGSFTGLRIGLSTARSLALALDKPAIGVNTLDAMAHHYHTDTKPLLIVLETKRKDFYARYYDVQGKPLCAPFAAEIQQVLEQAPEDALCVGGDCLDRFHKELNATELDVMSPSQNFEFLESLTLLDPMKLTEAGEINFDEVGSLDELQPLYLRGADISYPKHPPRKISKSD